MVHNVTHTGTVGKINLWIDERFRQCNGLFCCQWVMVWNDKYQILVGDRHSV